MEEIILIVRDQGCECKLNLKIEQQKVEMNLRNPFNYSNPQAHEKVKWRLNILDDFENVWHLPPLFIDT